MKVLIDIHSKSLFISFQKKKKKFLSQVHWLTCKTTLCMGPVINRTRFLGNVHGRCVKERGGDLPLFNERKDMANLLL